ncbi:MAG: ABC transporter permease [Opitutae bacterium]|nr:ABC transporter permease [Opitutae bacterium]
MTWLRQFLFRLQSLFRRRKIEEELDAEVSTHLEMATEANLAAGMPLEEARFAARRQFGGVDQIKESYRDARGFPWVDQLRQDLGLTLRLLRKSPGFTAVAILTLALGIGVNTTTFSFLNAILFRTLPFTEPARLVQLHRTSPQAAFGPHAPADLLDAQAQNEVFSHFAIIDLPSYSLAAPGEPPERVSAFAVSGDFFPMMGVPPLHGRVFGPAEDKPGHSQVVVLSHHFWMRRFGGDPAIVGRRLRLDGEPVEVIGVMPEQFYFPQLWGPRDLWKPLALAAPLANARDGYWLNAAARLKPGVTLVQAQANLNAIAGRLGREYPLTNAQSGYFLGLLGQQTRSESGPFFGMLMGLALSVLLIACANLANLQLARSSSRVHEYAVRIALGSGRWRLVRLLLTESLAISLLGGACGVLAAWGTSQLLAGQLARLMGDPNFSLPLDLRVLGFALLTALATGVLFGIAPAWLASKVDVNAGLKQAGRGMTGDRSRYRLRQLLVVGELSLTLMLLAGVGYFIHGFYVLAQRDLGWRQNHLLTARIALPSSRYGDIEKCRAFYERVNEELAATPGVKRTFTCDIIPLFGFYNQRPVVTEAATATTKGQEAVAFVNTTTPGYFDALGMKLLQGRDFTSGDRPGAPAVVIVNQTLAQQLWPGENPLGKRLGGPDPAKREWLEVVGVVNEVSYSLNPNPPTHLQIYRPMAQTGGNYFALAAYTSVAPETLADELRRAVSRVDPDLAAYEVTSLEQQLEQSGAGTAVILNGLLVMAGTGLLLSAIGIYGVIANLVIERTNEIGIRIALGAQLRDAVWLVLRQGLRLAVVGVLLGAAGATALAGVLGRFIPGMQQDPLVVAGGALLLVSVMLLACWLPARRAARVDPIVALKAE